MDRKIRIGTSPLTNTIYAGRLCVDGRTWRDGKQDVTIDALVAVAEHVLQYGKPVVIHKVGSGPSFEITARRLDEGGGDD